MVTLGLPEGVVHAPTGAQAVPDGAGNGQVGLPNGPTDAEVAGVGPTPAAGRPAGPVGRPWPEGSASATPGVAAAEVLLAAPAAAAIRRAAVATGRDPRDGPVVATPRRVVPALAREEAGDVPGPRLVPSVAEADPAVPAPSLLGAAPFPSEVHSRRRRAIAAVTLPCKGVCHLWLLQRVARGFAWKAQKAD